MLTHDIWLGTLLSRKLISPLTDPICDIALQIPNTSYININSSYKFNELISAGLENGWITAIGCPIHTNTQYTHSLTLDGAKSYDQSPYSIVTMLIEKAQEYMSCATFCDIGCGEGTTLKVASAHYNNIIGIELDLNLCTTASKVAPHANIGCIDAANYLLSPVPQHVYMFNPFNNAILNDFLRHNIDHFMRYGSLILYYNQYRADHLLKEYGMSPIWTDSFYSIYQYKGTI